MENKTQKYESPVDLVEEDPFNNNYQSGIYLSINWENEVVDVITLNRDGSTASDVWHKLRSLIQLPNNVDARYVRSTVDELLPKLEEIKTGFESSWDGSNWKGKFTEEAEDLLMNLEYEIENENLFPTFEGGGLWDAADWFNSKITEITATTTDEKIKSLAELYTSDATGDLVVIRGGAEATERLFRQMRDELVDEEESSKELISITITGPSSSFSREFPGSGFAVIGDDDNKQRIVKAQGTGARVDVPKNWIGHPVIVIRLDQRHHPKDLQA